MLTTDEQIGRNLSRFRGEMSQKDLAEKMRSMGWKWSQATVWSVEKGERPLRLAEAASLSEILKLMHATVLLSTDSSTFLTIARNKVIASQKALELAIRDHYLARFELALLADRERTSIGSNLLEIIEDWLSVTPASLADSVKAEMSAQREGERLVDAVLGLIPEDDEEEQKKMLENRGPFILKFSEDWDPYVKHSEAS